MIPALLERHPRLEAVSASKRTLTVTSRMIEDMAARGGAENLLMTCFQRGEYWTAQRERYLELETDVDVVVFLADPDGQATEGFAVGLPPEAPLAREWIVVALGPELAVVLCGTDADGEVLDSDPRPAEEVDEDDRLFEVVVSHDPDVVRTVAEALVDVAETHGSRRLEAARARLDSSPGPDAAAIARTADELTTGVLKRAERLRLAEQLAVRRSSQAKTEFLSRMGHELRNPLNAILGYAQLLELGDGEEADNAARIRRAGNHLLRLVDEVLDISQVESGRLRVDPVELEVSDVVLESLELIRTEASVRGVRLEPARALGGPVRVRGDRRLIVGILLNLLSNAVKFDRRGGRVRIEARTDAEWCHIDVCDSGPGIPAHSLHRVFEPFERLPGTADRTSGVGLGLSLSRSMAQASGARLDVASPPDEGATFTLSLPLATSPGGS